MIAIDPEGRAVVPQTGNFLVSDDYGPSVLEFDRGGSLIRRFTVPGNLVPKVGATINYASTPPTLTAGREPNRGFEGLAIGPDGKYAYAMLQNGTISDGWTSSAQGRGISSIVALGDDKSLVLERQ